MSDLKFQPPPDWLIQEYVNRPQPAEIANQGIQQGLQSYVTLKQQQDKQQKDATESYLKLLELDPALASTPLGQKLSKQMGGGLGNYQPPSLSASQTPATAPVQQSQPDMTPTPAENSAQMSMPSEHILNSVQNYGHPDITGHLAQVQAPNTPYIPTAQDVTNLQGRGKLGKSALLDQHTALEMARLGKELAGKGQLQTITKEKALANGTFDPSKQMIIEPPTPKGAGNDAATARLSDKQLADAQSAYNHDANVQKAQNVVDKVQQAVPLLKAGTIDNATAKQALQTAMTYMATGGMRVNEIELRQFGGANALTNKMGQWFKGIDAGTLTPRDAKDMGKVLDIFQQSAQKTLHAGGLRHTNQYLQRAQSGEQVPDAYKRVTGNDFAPDSGGGLTGPHGPSVTQNGHTYNWNPQKNQYE